MSNPLMENWWMLASTVRRHRKPIFNYFDAPYTNAFVEGLNSVICEEQEGCQ